MFFRVFTIGVVLLLSTNGAAQDHSAHRIPDVPMDLLSRPVTVRRNIGPAHDIVATSSREAQAFYDQGLAYLHGYVWIEAARSFNQALRLDPQLAMAHAGLSVAYIELNKPSVAAAALARAQQLAAWSERSRPAAHCGARRPDGR